MENQNPQQEVPQQTPPAGQTPSVGSVGTSPLGGATPAENSNRSFWKTLGIGLSIVSFCIAIAIGGYIYVASKNKAAKISDQKVSTVQETPIATPTPAGQSPLGGADATANWQTYTNTKLGFSIKYPPQMQLELIGNIDSFHQGEMTICCGYSGPNLNIVVDNPVGLNRAPSDVESNFNIAGQNLTKLSGVAGTRIGLLKHSNHAFVFEIFGKDKTEADFGEIYQILSTFKFTQ